MSAEHFQGAIGGRLQRRVDGDHQTVFDGGVSKRLTLWKGANTVRCAVINGGGATLANGLADSATPFRGGMVRWP